jgi:hypothetical protein
VALQYCLKLRYLNEFAESTHFSNLLCLRRIANSASMSADFGNTFQTALIAAPIHSFPVRSDGGKSLLRSSIASAFS